MASEGKDTSEWTAMKWIVTVCGIVGTALTSVVAALIGSGTVEAGDPVAIVLGGIAGVALAIGGQAGVAYIKGRSAIKAEEAKQP